MTLPTVNKDIDIASTNTLDVGALYKVKDGAHVTILKYNGIHNMLYFDQRICMLYKDYMFVYLGIFEYEHSLNKIRGVTKYNKFLCGAEIVYLYRQNLYFDKIEFI